MGLDKLSIQAFSDPKFSSRRGGPYAVQINPEELSHNFAIQLSDASGMGSSAAAHLFNRVFPETLSFTIWFDRSGVVPGFPRNGSTSLAQQITLFKSVVFNYHGETHSPNYLQLSWGTFVFQGQLTKLDLTYTLFRPDGEPVRAKCVVSFQSFVAPSEAAAKAQNQSADLTHLVTVKAGDTLPMLCHRVYGSSAPYAAVARVNGLSSFRRLQPGTLLRFPPLRTSRS